MNTEQPFPYVTINESVNDQLTPRQIVWLEVYKAHVAAGNEYPLNYVHVALTAFEQTFCEAK